MVTAIVLGLLALGAFTAVLIAAWTIAAIAKAIFGLFASKDKSIKTTMGIGDEQITNEVIVSLRRKNPELADRLQSAITGDSPKHMFVWSDAEGKVKDVNVLSAEDASVDEINGKILRFDKEGQTIREY